MTNITIQLDEAEAEAVQREAAQAGVSIQEWLRLQISRRVSRGVSKPVGEKSEKVSTFEEYLKLLPPDFKSPTDEEVEKILLERRMRHLLP